MPIRHFNTGAKRKKLRGILKIFTKELERKLDSNATIKAMDKWSDASDEELLRLRKMLVIATRKGMLERRDMEMEIAMLACFVWWNRLEVEKRFALEMQA